MIGCLRSAYRQVKGILTRAMHGICGTSMSKVAHGCKHSLMWLSKYGNDFLFSGEKNVQLHCWLRNSVVEGIFFAQGDWLW